ncbi:MAG TPA: ABC transporter permease [Candidatus Binatia bacterium]|nr:ABC transporter permease [Candidatus Binatia bacterium]
MNPQTLGKKQIVSGDSFMSAENVWRDIRFALRSLLKTPGFTLVAILVIAVGIGANSAVFSVINAVLLKPLTYPDPQSLVEVMNTGNDSDPFASVPKFNIWQQQRSIFQHVAAYDTGGAGLNLTGNDQPEQVQGVHVSGDYFATLGAPVIVGRTFTEAEDSPHGGNVVVLSYGLWKRRYGGNRDIVGNNIQLNGQPYQVVGVIGREFATENPADLWLPFQFELSSTNPANYFFVIARLKTGVTVPMANAQLKLAADQYRTTYPDRLGPNNGFGVVLLQELMVRDTQSSLYVLLGAVGLVLLIACANVANLLLIRATARKRELATRSALGAGRRHIIRQLLTESLLISLSGGVLGLVLGFTGVRFLLAINPGSIPRIGEDASAVKVDLNVLLFTLAISLLTGILFGVVPAISSSRKNLAAILNESSNRGGVGLRSGKTRSLLVVTEMALALVLVIGAALLIRTFVKLQSVDPGFDTHNVLTMAMSISGDRFLKTGAVAQVLHDGTERINAVPGVTATAAACCLPLQGGFGLPFNIVGRANGNNPTTGGAEYIPVSWSYFDVFKVPVLRGRNFTRKRQRGRSGRCHHQSDDGATVLAKQRSAERPPGGRSGHGASLCRATEADHRRCGRYARWRT